MVELRGGGGPCTVVELEGGGGPCAVVELRGGSVPCDVPGGGVLGGVGQLEEWNDSSRRKEIGVSLKDNLTYFTVHVIKRVIGILFD
jgi:hypothetical protein